jgi:hypothetical protein
MMKFYNPPEEKRRRAVIHVVNRLQKLPKNWAGFGKIRSYLGDSYTDEFLRDLIEKNPEVFTSVRLKTSAGDIEGITLVQEK